MTAVELRRYRDDDLAPLVAVFTAAVHELGAAHYTPQQLDAWAPRTQGLDAWRDHLGSLETLVAAEAGRLAAFVSFEPNGHIALLYTSPAHARRGLASLLYRRAEECLLCLGVRRIFTEASLVARPFFERLGFVATAEDVVGLRGESFRRYAMQKAATECVVGK